MAHVEEGTDADVTGIPACCSYSCCSRASSHNPMAQGYNVVRRFQRGQFLSPQVFPELELAVDVLLG